MELVVEEETCQLLIIKYFFGTGSQVSPATAKFSVSHCTSQNQSSHLPLIL